MKKILHTLLIGFLLFSSVGRVTAFDWEKYFPSSVGNTIESFENRFGEGVTKKVVVGATAIAVAVAGYLLYVNKSFSRFWNWARGEGGTDLKKKEKIVTEKYESEKNKLEERFKELNEQFITLKPENENYAEELSRLSSKAQSLLKDTGQFKFKDLYNKIFNLNSDVIAAKKLILKQKHQLLSIEKDVNQKLQSIQEDLFAKNLDKEEVFIFEQRLQEVLDEINKYKLDNAYIQQVEELKALVKKPEELTESTALKDQPASSTEESFQESEKSLAAQNVELKKLEKEAGEVKELEEIKQEMRSRLENVDTLEDLNEFLLETEKFKENFDNIPQGFETEMKEFIIKMIAEANQKIEVIISSFPKNIKTVNFSMQEKKTTGPRGKKKTVVIQKNLPDIGYAEIIYQGDSDLVTNVIVLDECEEEPIDCWNNQIPFNSEAEKQIRDIQINIFKKTKKVPQLNIYYVIVNRNLKTQSDLADKIVKKLKNKVSYINMVSHFKKEDVDFLSNLASILVNLLKKNNIMD